MSAGSLETYWNRFADNQTPESRERSFGWTQYEGHGPGEELLDQPNTVLELGCGHGADLAYLTRKGIRGVGVDLSHRQIDIARERWGARPGTRFVCDGAVGYLSGSAEKFDAIFSRFGALWFSNPREWAPLVRERLTGGGVLVFSCAAPVEGCYGAQGFLEVFAKTLEAPDPKNVGTLIVQAWA
jgi:SAM-dependent methyltransferase